MNNSFNKMYWVTYEQNSTKWQFLFNAIFHVFSEILPIFASYIYFENKRLRTNLCTTSSYNT